MALDHAFAFERDRLLLRNIGLTDSLQQFVVESHPDLLHEFHKAHAYFERAQSVRGVRACPDGLTHDAISRTRDLLRELPGLYLEMDEPAPIGADRFMIICASDYATPKDRNLTPYRKRMISAFQNR